MASKLTLSSTLPLPDSSNQIPRLGFGVYKSTAETCVQSCLTALKAGYRHIDSAQFYANEAQVGQAVNESGIPREEIYITTKVLTASSDVPTTYQRIVESVKKIDDRPNGYVDLFLIHNASTSEEGNKIMWQALEQAKAEGKVKEIGVSNAGKKHIEALKEYATSWPPPANQIEVREQTGGPAIAHAIANNVIAAPVEPAARSCEVLPVARHRRPGLLPTRPQPES